MPNKTGRFHLYSDTSKFATGSALYQIQNGMPKLIAYASKRLPGAAKSYSITELSKAKWNQQLLEIKRLLELISSYSFNLYYMKGKDMILSDFLSQQSNDDSNPSEIIPISFNTYKI